MQLFTWPDNQLISPMQAERLMLHTLNQAPECLGGNKTRCHSQFSSISQKKHFLMLLNFFKVVLSIKDITTIVQIAMITLQLQANVCT